MDDEEIIREVFVDMLQSTFYRIDLAANSSEALEKFQNARHAGAPYDLLFLDLTGPGDIGGIKTLEKIRAIDPDAIAIAISGYSVSEVCNQPDRFHFHDFLSKPFRPDDLLDIIGKNLKKLNGKHDGQDDGRHGAEPAGGSAGHAGDSNPV